MTSRSLTARLTRPVSTCLADLLICLRFYSRLPIPRLDVETRAWEAGAFGRALRMAPLAGLVIGGIGAMILAAGTHVLGLPPFIAAALAIGAQIVLSGAMHEDGIADVADGFGGGATRERKLDIMRDSRIGTFGALALIFTLLLRIGALAALLDRYGLVTAATILPAAAAVSRGFGLLPLAFLPPARTSGLAHAAGALSPLSLAVSVGSAVFLGTILAYAGGLAEARASAACGVALLASFTMVSLAHRQIGGQTGDVAGAAQQMAEIGYLLALLVAPRLG